VSLVVPVLLAFCVLRLGVLVNRLPTAIRVVFMNRRRRSCRVLAEILFIGLALVVHDERHDAGIAVLAGMAISAKPAKGLCCAPSAAGQ